MKCGLIPETSWKAWQNGLITVDRSLRVATFNPTALEILRKPKERSGRASLFRSCCLWKMRSDESFQIPTQSWKRKLRLPVMERQKTFFALSVSPLKGAGVLDHSRGRDHREGSHIDP